VWLSGRAYSEGIEEHDMGGAIVRVYSAPKSVADCFRFRNKIGRDIAVEALKDYLKSSDRDLSSLLSFARIDRVEKLMQPYLESLV